MTRDQQLVLAAASAAATAAGELTEATLEAANLPDYLVRNAVAHDLVVALGHVLPLVIDGERSLPSNLTRPRRVEIGEMLDASVKLYLEDGL